MHFISVALLISQIFINKISSSDFLSWHPQLRSVSLEIALYFLNCPLSSKYIQIVYIFRMLAACPWVARAVHLWLQDDWQPITATSKMLIGQLRHLHMLEVILSLIDSSRGQRSAWHLWGSNFAHGMQLRILPFAPESHRGSTFLHMLPMKSSNLIGPHQRERHWSKDTPLVADPI